MTAAEPLPMAATTGARARERALIEAVAATVSRLRRNAGMDVERLAALSGLPRDQIVAIETGRTSLHVRLLWALADAFEVPFSVLLSGAPCATTSFHVLRAADAPVVASTGGGFRTRPLSVAGDPREPEVYEVTLEPGWLEKAAPHAVDTFEHVVVVRGMLTVRAGASTAVLAPGDAVFFRADCPHAYQNPGIDQTLLHLTMTYAGDWGGSTTD
jgi:transcriptional regulator with XRE-family HTH domain